MGFDWQKSSDASSSESKERLRLNHNAWRSQPKNGAQSRPEIKIVPRSDRVASRRDPSSISNPASRLISHQPEHPQTKPVGSARSKDTQATLIPRAAENEVWRDQPERARVRFGIQSSLELSNRTRARSG